MVDWELLGWLYLVKAAMESAALKVYVHQDDQGYDEHHYDGHVDNCRSVDIHYTKTVIDSCHTISLHCWLWLAGSTTHSEVRVQCGLLGLYTIHIHTCDRARSILNIYKLCQRA